MTATASAMTTSVPRHPRRPTSFAIRQPPSLSPSRPSAPDPQVLPDERARVVERAVRARRRAHLDDRDRAAEPHLRGGHLPGAQLVGEADLPDPAAQRRWVAGVPRDGDAAELELR